MSDGRKDATSAVFTTVSPDTVLAMPIDILFDFAGVHVSGPRATAVDIRIDFVFTDLDETWTMWIKRGVLNARKTASPDTQLTVSGPKEALVGVILKPAAAPKLAGAGQITLAGDASVLETFAGVLDEFDPNFEIIAP